MALTVDSFRQTFPEFTDPEKYKANQIQLFITLGASFQNLFRWDPNAVDYGAGLFVAHHMVLEARNSATSSAGGIPGTVQGVINNKSVDKVSVAYDVDSVVEKDASFWNMTTYGIRFYQLTRAYGSGGYQVGAGPAGPAFGGGWPGCW